MGLLRRIEEQSNEIQQVHPWYQLSWAICFNMQKSWAVYVLRTFYPPLLSPDNVKMKIKQCEPKECFIWSGKTLPIGKATYRAVKFYRRWVASFISNTQLKENGPLQDCPCLVRSVICSDFEREIQKSLKAFLEGSKPFGASILCFKPVSNRFQTGFQPECKLTLVKFYRSGKLLRPNRFQTGFKLVSNWFSTRMQIDSGKTLPLGKLLYRW